MADPVKPSAVAVAQVAYDAGFRGRSLVQAVALALAESGGNPNAINDNPRTGDYSVGLWQINYYDQLRPARTKQFGAPESLRGIDPTGPEAHANAKAAYALSGGGRVWSPWQADFNNGRYYNNLPAAEAAVAQFGAAGSSVGSPGSSFGPGSGSGVLATSTGVPPVTNPEAGVGVDTPPDMSGEADHCLFKFPGIAGVGSFCILSTNSARAIGGGLIMVAGAAVGLVGVALLTGNSRYASMIPGVPGQIAGAVHARSASKAQDVTDEDAAHAEQVQDEQRSDTGRSARARKAFKGESREPFTDEDRTLRLVS